MLRALKNHGWPIIVLGIGFLAVNLHLAERGLDVATTDVVVREVQLDSLMRILDDMRGKVVLLNFWTTWCAPCRREIPGFIDIQNRYRSRGLEVIGLSFDEQGIETVQKFARSAGVNYTMLWGYPDRESIHKAFGFRHAYPTTYLIERDGKVIASFEGYHRIETFSQKIEDLLSGKTWPSPEVSDEPPDGKLKIIVIGPKDDARTKALAQAALQAKGAGDTVHILDPKDAEDRKRMDELMVTELPEPSATVCDESMCSMPVTTPEDLVQTIRRMRER